MPRLRYTLRTDWLFYLLVVAYAYSIGAMTFRLWFGDGVNIFASYSDATAMSDVILDHNKVYWAKTSFLFSSIFLFALNFDYRAAVGIAAAIWGGALITIFGPTPPVVFILTNGVLLVALQTWRGELFGAASSSAAAPPRQEARS